MKKKTIILIVAAVVILIAIFYMCSGSTQKNKITFENTKVSRSDISTSVTSTGTLEAVTSVSVGTQVSGIVTKVLADYNSVVKKGQIIAELDKTNLETLLNSRKASLESARSQYEYQLKNFQRSKQLHAKTLISQSDYDTALYNYKTAKESYNIAKSDYITAKTNVGYATIYSPIDGVVISRAIEAGQTVASSYSTPTLFTIAKNLKDMQVIANVDEADIGDVAVGQRVSFTVDAYPDNTFEGTVKQVRQGATTTNNVVTYPVVISAPNADLKLKPGLTANITIYTLEKKNVLSVPSKALRFTPEKPLIGEKDKVVDCNAKHKLWTREGMTFTAHAVTVGINNGIRTEITGGIAEGSTVILDAISGQMPGENASATSDTTKASSSPFMPTGPKNNKSEKK